MDKFKIISVKNINNLPTTAGVYAFYAKKSQVIKNLQPTSYNLQPIYIGKAININSRVKNHFSSPTYKDNVYIKQIEKIGFIETGSEIQALILEANLIKKYQPKFNQVWRDDKNYFYVALRYAQGKLKIPYVFITHQPNQNLQATSYKLQPKHIGPFVDGNALKKTIRFLRKVFPYYTTNKHSKLKCQWCHLDLCPGPKLFENPPSPKASEDLREYKTNIKKLILVLEGKSSIVLRSLKKEMQLASKNQDFERASKIRDQIFALERVINHSKVGERSDSSPILQFTGRIECYDISNIQGKFAVGSMVVFTNGKPNKAEYKKFRIKMKNEPNDIAMLSEVLQRRFSHKDWPYPEIILVDGGKGQINVAINIKNKLLTTNYKLQTIKIISIAKGKQQLFIEGQKNPIPLKNLPQEIYNLIKNLDNEAHRFAITYHKKLRKQNLLKNLENRVNQ